MTREAGVPGVRVRHVHRLEGRRHRKVGADDRKHGVGVGKQIPAAMTGCVRSWRTEAMHVELHPATQVRGELLHVDAGTAIDVWRPLAGEQRDVHAPTLWSRIAL